MISVVNVNDAPVWQTVCNDQNLTEMEPLLCNVWAMDVDIGDIVTYDMSMQPVSDITIDQTTGVIFWERSVVGNYSMNVSATDGEVIIYHTFIIKVNKIPPNNPPQFKSIPAVQAETGHLFRMVIEGIDADPWDEINLSFRLVSGPEGMIISTNGTILWLPLRGQAGSHTITVTLSDGKNSTEKSFQVSVLKSSEKSDVAATGYSIGWLVAIAIIGIIIGGGMAYAATRNAKRKTISAKAHDYGDDKNNNK
jgi:hypothetical protein